jgi:acetoacetyl-CoA reductase/3-oxoacyl-[acyl-carrier protein] reductase
VNVAITETYEELRPHDGERVDGRVALVTGGTRGIGAAISRRLAAHGAAVAASYGRDHDSARRLQAELGAAGAPISIHVGDISSADDCRRIVEDVIEHHGRLDILVNNAGITIDRTALKMEDSDWHKVIEVNLSGAFFTSQAALAHMLERGSGRIVNISSIIGQTGNIGQANYAASKSGIHGLTQSLAREAAFALKRTEKLTANGLNVTVNAVAPGFIETDMLEAVPAKAKDRILAQVPLDRFGRPDEVARVVHFLAADGAAYITGQLWAINGGQEM